jgi:hypothetical protein
MGRKEKDMATAAQITANQNNAAHSTGPKTPEGKSAAARNSTKHGLSGAFTVLPHEDQDEFDILLACLRDDFQPANQHESFLVEQMSKSRWSLSRAQRLETAIFDQMLLGEIAAGDPDQRIAAKLLTGGDRGASDDPALRHGRRAQLLQSTHRTAEIEANAKRSQNG